MGTPTSPRSNSLLEFVFGMVMVGVVVVGMVVGACWRCRALGRLHGSQGARIHGEGGKRAIWCVLCSVYVVCMLWIQYGPAVWPRHGAGLAGVEATCVVVGWRVARQSVEEELA